MREYALKTQVWEAVMSNDYLKNCVLPKILTIFAFSTVLLSAYPQKINAQARSIDISGTQYIFEDKSDYTLSEATYVYPIPSENGSKSDFGTFSITGELKPAGEKEGIQAYNVIDGNIQFTYSPNGPLVGASEEFYHVVDDTSKEACDVTLPEKIKAGAIILQTSIDPDHSKWVTEQVFTNIAGQGTDFSSDFYSTKNIQQINGCYYRVIIIYRAEKKLPTKKMLVLPSYSQRKHAEIYEFYVKNDESGLTNHTSHDTEPRATLASLKNTERVENKEKTDDYNAGKPIGGGDPHQGINLGYFRVNGYTVDKIYDEKRIFLKNFGDTVTLWYELEQDIDKLDGNEKLTIADDKKDCDSRFPEIKTTDFHRGALLIRHTDRWGNETITKYFNFLEADSRTDANTQIELFEEGDYNVVLDYAIKDSDGIDSYYYYTVSFDFGIRNGNCMFYVFDKSTGNELADNAVASEGIRIDLAKSQYLDFEVTRTAIIDRLTGKTEDTRAKKPDKDGAEYTEPGIYTFKVSHNTIPDMSVTKTYYIGTDPYLKLMSISGKTLKEVVDIVGNDGEKYLNAMLKNNQTLEGIARLINDDNYTINDEGQLIPPSEPAESNDSASNEPPVDNPSNSINVDDNPDFEDEVLDVESLNDSPDEAPQQNSATEQLNEKKSSSWLGVIVIVVVLAVVVIFLFTRKSKRSNGGQR